MSNSSSVFEVRRLPFLLMTEAEKQSQRLAAIIEQPFADEPQPKTTISKNDIDLYYRLPSYLSLKGHEGAVESFTKYMKENDKPHEEMVSAAIHIATAHDYISDAEKRKEFPRSMYNHAIRYVQNGFRALQKIGQQHNHNYIGDMIDKARSVHHEYQQKQNPNTFLKEPFEMKDFKSLNKNNLISTDAGKTTAEKPMMEGFIDDTATLDEGLRSEFSANLHLNPSNKVGSESHHVFVKTRGKRKSIAGPFSSEDEAKAHPAFKWGDGVCKGAMCENVSDGDATLVESGTFKVSKTFYNKRAGKYMKRKVPTTTTDSDKE